MDCSICQHTFKVLDKIYATVCGHIFHLHCLMTLFQWSNQCPNCRSMINIHRIYRLFLPIQSESSSKSDLVCLINENTILKNENRNLRTEIENQKQTFERINNQVKTLKADQKILIKNLQEKTNQIQALETVEKIIRVYATQIYDILKSVDCGRSMSIIKRYLRNFNKK